MSPYWWIQVVITAVLVVDAFRRPPSLWALADRQRWFWVAILAVCALFAVGPLGWALYGAIVLPSLHATRSGYQISPAFMKK
jgi:hypothetical protein